MKTIAERQAALRQELKDAQAEISRKKNNAACRKAYRRRKTTPWHELREDARLKREGVAARKAARAERKRLKEETKRLKAEARKRKHRDPVKAWNDAFLKGVEAGRLMQRAEDKERETGRYNP